MLAGEVVRGIVVVKLFVVLRALVMPKFVRRDLPRMMSVGLSNMWYRNVVPRTCFVAQANACIGDLAGMACL